MNQKKYNITCHLTSKGWQLSHDYDKMSGEPVRMQRDFHTIIDTLSEKMAERDNSQSQFKICISFRPCEDRRFYRQSIDYEQAKCCPANYSQYGMELYSILKEELGLGS